MRTGAMPANRRDSGFTIIELMIVVSIIGVLAAIAIPAFNDLIKDNRRTVVANELIANLLLARAESAKRGQPVTVCGNTSGGGTSCTGAGTWDYGWMVFIDINGNGAIGDDDIDRDGDTDSTDVQLARLRSYVNDYSDIKIRSDTYGKTNGYIALRPFNQTGIDATLKICDKRGATKARAVIVETNGRSRVSEKDKDGNVLTCP